MKSNWNRMVQAKSIAGVTLLGALGILGLAWVGGCPSDQQPGANEVLMRNIAFFPAEITIAAGETVTWRNVDIVPHTATSGNPGEPDIGSVFRVPAAGLLLGGSSDSHTFNEVGEFIYFCEVHPGMMLNAKVIVEP